MTDPARLARALHLTASAREPGRFVVIGGAGAHQVTTDGGRLACDCRDAEVRGGPCKHLLAVALLALDAGVRAALRELVAVPRRRPAPVRRGR